MRLATRLFWTPTIASSLLCFTLGTPGCGTNPSPGSGGKNGSGGAGGTTGETGGAGGVAGLGAGAGSGGAVGGAGGVAAQAGTGGAAGALAGTAGLAGGGAGGASGAGAGAGGSAGALAGGSAGAGDGGMAGANGGAGGDAAGAGGFSGGAGAAGAGGGVWACPSGMTGTPTLGGTPTRITAVPPHDSFNMNNASFGNIEGPVWTGDALYMTEMTDTPYPQLGSEVKMARLLKFVPGGQVTIVLADSGTNGLALEPSGNLLGCVHKDGSVKRFTLPGGAATTLVGTYMNVRFDSPNDLALHSNGTLYFSDPSFQSPSPPPQARTLVYRVAPAGNTAEPIPSGASPDMFTNPNGVTLSLAEDYLYVAAEVGRRYPVMPDGTITAGANFTQASGGDGMVIDCAGNLYVAKSKSPNVDVYTPQGAQVGTITVPDVQEVTNVAFGGVDRKTLYITGLGTNKGLFELPLDIPGRPY